MKMQDLEALGFIAVAGNVDRLGRNYGILTADGPVLTPEGEELVAALTAQPAAAKPKKSKPAPDADPLAGLDLD